MEAGRSQVTDTFSPSRWDRAFTTSVMDQAVVSSPAMAFTKSPCCTPLASASEPSKTPAT